MNSHKAQVSMEFIMISSFVLVFFIGFLYIANNRMSEIGEKEDIFEMQKLADAIKNEIILAAQVHKSYVRRFEIPLKLNGKNYTMQFLPEDDPDKEVLSIEILDSGLSETFNLPFKVSGGFVTVQQDALDYCVAKGRSREEISVSKNQLELFEGSGFNADGTVTNGNQFSLYVKGNCIENLQTAGFKIIYPTGSFSFQNARRAHDHTDIPGTSPHVTGTITHCDLTYECDIYGDVMFDGAEEDDASNPINRAYLSIDDEFSCSHPTKKCIAISISHKGKSGPVGSDNLIELVFTAPAATGTYEMKIEEPPDIVDSRIRFIPPSVQGIEIEVT